MELDIQKAAVPHVRADPSLGVTQETLDRLVHASKEIPSPAQLDAFIGERFLSPNPELQKSLGGGLKRIPYAFIADGCYARAHVHDDLLESHSVNNGKIFAEGDLSARNEVFPDGVHWGFHVATLVVVKEDGALSLRVVDPPLSPHAQRPEDWLRQINDSGSPVSVQVTPRAQYFPKGPHPATFDESLPFAQQTLRTNRSVLREMKAGTTRLDDARWTHTSVPLAVDDQTGSVTMKGTPRLLTVTKPNQVTQLKEAIEAAAPVTLLHNPVTGQIRDVTG